MATATYANREVYQVFINAPIDKVWSELIKTTSPHQKLQGIR
jgi:hypothetical protein